MSAAKVIQIALNEVGYLEKKSNASLNGKTANAGSNNYTKYGAWYDNGVLQAQAWCDMFVSWCAYQAGEASAVGHYAYCPSHVNFFKNKGQYFKRGAKTPQTGDIIFFATDGVIACHVGIVEKVRGNYVHTIEGNTSGASTLVANGGGVCQKSYSLTSTYILGYGRPAYAAEKTYTVGWNQDSKGWWYVHEDGSYTTSNWEYINGNWYYFDASGYMYANRSFDADGKTYSFDADGHLTVTTIQTEEDDDMDVARFKELWNEMRKELQDNDCGSWSEEARQWAIDNGVIAGMGTGANGQPNYAWADLLTREQAVTLFYRFAKLMGQA